MISVIIPSYKSGKFLGECLNSVLNQDYFINNDFDILVGFDGVEKIGDLIKPIEHKNIKYFYTDKRVYPYIIRNSLVKKSNGDIYLFFDADDVMVDNMISRIIDIGCHYARYTFFDFLENIQNSIQRKNLAMGTFFIYKNLFDIAGGFMDWKCAADRCFHTRMMINGIKPKEINEPLFYRRIHNNALTTKEDTRMGSDIRKEYYKLIDGYKDAGFPIYVEPNTTELFEL